MSTTHTVKPIKRKLKYQYFELVTDNPFQIDRITIDGDWEECDYVELGMCDKVFDTFYPDSTPQILTCFHGIRIGLMYPTLQIKLYKKNQEKRVNWSLSVTGDILKLNGREEMLYKNMGLLNNYFWTNLVVPKDRLVLPLKGICEILDVQFFDKEKNKSKDRFTNVQLRAMTTKDRIPADVVSINEKHIITQLGKLLGDGYLQFDSMPNTELAFVNARVVVQYGLKEVQMGNKPKVEWFFEIV